MFLSRQKKLHLIFIEFYATKNVCLRFFLGGGGTKSALFIVDNKLTEKEKIQN